MSKIAIPTTNSGNLQVDRALAAVKQNLDDITGQARNVQRLDPLPSTATLAEVITQLNRIVERLQ